MQLTEYGLNDIPQKESYILPDYRLRRLPPFLDETEVTQESVRAGVRAGDALLALLIYCLQSRWSEARGMPAEFRFKQWKSIKEAESALRALLPAGSPGSSIRRIMT